MYDKGKFQRKYSSFTREGLNYPSLSKNEKEKLYKYKIHNTHRSFQYDKKERRQITQWLSERVVEWRDHGVGSHVQGAAPAPAAQAGHAQDVRGHDEGG